MRAAVELSLSRQTKSDIAAIVSYLRSVPAVPSDLPKLAGWSGSSIPQYRRLLRNYQSSLGLFY
jgi:hypothetical protein